MEAEVEHMVEGDVEAKEEEEDDSSDYSEVLDSNFEEN